MATQLTFGALSAKENKACLSPTKQMRKLRVQLSDKLFEIRKLQEDYAEEKAHLLMNHTTEKNQLNQTINELKDKLAEENQHWTAKIDQIRNDHAKNIFDLNQQWLGNVQKEINVRTTSIKQNYDKENLQLRSTIARLEAAVKNNQKRFDTEIYNLKEAQKRQMSNLQEQKQKRIVEQKKNMQRDENLKINAIMHIKATEQKQHRKTKEQLAKNLQQFEKYKAKNQIRIFQLRQQIWALKKQLNEHSQQNKKLVEQLNQLQKKSHENVQMSIKDYEEKIKSIEEGWKTNIVSLNEKWINEYKKLQTAFQKAQTTMGQKERLWDQRGNKVFQLYTKREARQEDMKLIENLEVQLIKKEFELEREKQQLKSCKMELDNMDDIYKRIFHSAHKSNRQSASFHLKKVKLPGILNRSSNPLKNTIDH